MKKLVNRSKLDVKKVNSTKLCWQASQYKKGWRVGLCVGNKKPIWLQVWFQDEKAIEITLRQTGIVFVEMANNREKE